MLITKALAPSYSELRPLKPHTTPTFPVYQDLVDSLVAAKTHPDRSLLRHR